MKIFQNTPNQRSLGFIGSSGKQARVRSKSDVNLGSSLQAAWHQTMHSLTHGNELRIWHSRDRHGNVIWYAHDPLTGATVSRLSEQDMRMWVEGRY